MNLKKEDLIKGKYYYYERDESNHYIFQYLGIEYSLCCREQIIEHQSVKYCGFCLNIKK